MKNHMKVLCTLLGGALLACSMRVHASNVAIMSWSLLDSGKHLDWDGTSEYLSYFQSGVDTWNDYKPGVIRQDSWNTIEDVAISDYYEQNSVSGYTDKAGMICFNKYNMSRYSSAEKQHTCTHELGHALGLAHNQFGDIMYAELTYHTVLSENDKASYDASYNR
ncbi:MAG: matrixin family metalloprotease [Lachnospiraceae bacterium]|nr:matrixin family metalloprotease [Lachnospiraceae bacterium]